MTAGLFRPNSTCSDGPHDFDNVVTIGPAGSLVVRGQANVVNNIEIGSTVPLGDNGIGEIQLANATTVPTTNPVGGALVYAVGGGVFHRDPSGAVNALISSSRAGVAMPGAIAETGNRFAATTAFTPVSGTLYIYSILLVAGESVGHIGFCTGATAANGPTHWWAALLDNGYKQQAHSADQLSTALPGSTWQNLAMVTPFMAAYTGTYYLSLMVTTTTTQPTVVGNTGIAAAQFITGANVPTPLVNGLSSTAQTVPGTDGVTIFATPTAAAQTMYMYASA